MTIYREIHDLLLVSQRRVRRAREGLKSPLSSVEAIILGYLHQEQSLSAGEIASILGLSKATLSELLTDLEKQHCIVSSIDTNNRRKKTLSFTPRGKRLLEELETIQAEVRKLAFGMLTKDELEDYGQFLNMLANGLGARELKPLPKQSPFGIQQRRIMQIMGLISQNYMATGYELHEYQILLEVALKGPWVSFQHLIEELPFHPSRISRAISRLERKHLLQKKIPKEDKRMLLVSYTDKGKEHFNELEEQIAAKFESALKNLSQFDLEKYKRYIERITAGDLRAPEISPIEFKLCEDKRLRYQARAFLIEKLVQQNLHTSLEPEVLPDESFCLVALLNKKIEGLIEITHDNHLKQFSLKYFFISPALKPGQDDLQFIQQALKIVSSKYPDQSFIIPAGILPPNLLSRLSPLKKKSGRVVLSGNDIETL